MQRKHLPPAFFRIADFIGFIGYGRISYQEYRDLILRKKRHQRNEQNSQCNTKPSHNNYLMVTAFLGTSLPFTTWSFAIFEASTLTLSEALPRTLITGSAEPSLV